jgi:hypothetical protein
VSRSCACIGLPCLRQCVHGASIGGLSEGGGGGYSPSPSTTSSIPAASGSRSQASRDAERARAESLRAMGEEWISPTTAAQVRNI